MGFLCLNIYTVIIQRRRPEEDRCRVLGPARGRRLSGRTTAPTKPGTRTTLMDTEAQKVSTASDLRRRRAAAAAAAAWSARPLSSRSSCSRSASCCRSPTSAAERPRVEIGYRDVGRRPGCSGGGRREGGPACSGRATATMARTRKELPGSRGSPCRITARGRPERDTPSDGGSSLETRPRRPLACRALRAPRPRPWTPPAQAPPRRMMAPAPAMALAPPPAPPRA